MQTFQAIEAIIDAWMPLSKKPSFSRHGQRIALLRQSDRHLSSSKPWRIASLVVQLDENEHAGSKAVVSMNWGHYGAWRVFFDGA